MGKVLIVGGATGIGKAAVKAFAAGGDQVMLVDIDERKGEELAEDLAIEFVQCDVSKSDVPARVVLDCINRMGGLDTLFYNAGVLSSAPLKEWDAELWNRSIAVNLSAPFFFVQAAAPALEQSTNASVILTASTGALRGHAQMHAYHATKSGLIGLTRSLADELSPSGIRVNALLPGFIDTPFNTPFWSSQANPQEAQAELASSIPMRRQGRPEDVAGVVTFLASPAAAYVTGTQIVVDGGYSAV